jgi:hypothetical protein
MSVAKAAEVGTHRDLLVALRDRLADTVASPTCPARELASLSRRLMEITREVAAIDKQAEQETQEAQTPDEIWDERSL